LVYRGIPSVGFELVAQHDEVYAVRDTEGIGVKPRERRQRLGVESEPLRPGGRVRNRRAVGVLVIPDLEGIQLPVAVEKRLDKRGEALVFVADGSPER
jgi:hypothetical protein